MARQTRAQRRARRQAQAESREQQQADGRARPAAIPQAAASAPADWPGQSQVIQATTVVLLACAIVGTYLWGADLILKRLVEKVFLGQ